MIAPTPFRTVQTPLGCVEVRVIGGGRVTIDTRISSGCHHELVVNTVAVHLWVTLENAEEVEINGHACWRSCVNVDEHSGNGRGLFWGYGGFGVYWKNESAQRSESWSKPMTDVGKSKLRRVVYSAVVDWLATDEGKQLLDEGQQRHVERQIKEAEGLVREAERVLSQRRAELEDLKARRELTT